MAIAAGVSTATVSRVLTPERAEQVSEKTRRKVVSAVATLGYRTNHAARSLKTRSTKTIAIVAPELANDFFMKLAEGVEQELDQQGYTLLVASSANSAEGEKKRIATLADRMVDGIIIIPTGSLGDQMRLLASAGVPVVLVDRLVTGAEFDAVLSDNETGAYELTKALISDGYHSIAFVGGDLALSSAQERLTGYNRAMTEADLKPEPKLVCLGGMGVADGYIHMEALMKYRKLPKAMVAVNLLVHLGMERYLLEYRRKARVAGNDGESGSMVIAGFDEADFSPFLPACRYTAAQDGASIGKHAAKLILERIAHKKKTESPVPGKRIIRLPVRIIRHYQEEENS
ncbi:LacI family transcriptional regulator [Spirochaetia bacterium]|nr:LacI family transcriptional regulator [Spirochaetia bacterium]